MPRRIVHISDVLNFKACRRAWSFSSRQHRNLTPREAYSPFFIGSGVHHAIEYLISDGIAPTTSLAQYLRPVLQTRRQSSTWHEELFTVRKDVKLMRALMAQYQVWSQANRGPFADRNLDYIAHEVRFDEGADADWPAVRLEVGGVPLHPEIWLAGKFDGLARRKSDGSVWLIEHKTCRSIRERSALLQHDEQATAYSYAASTLFEEPVAGVIYTLLRKKEAAIPKEVRGGRLSVDKRIDTSVEVYRDAITRLHGTLSEKQIQATYGEVLQYIADFAEPFVARVAIQRSQAQIDAYIRELHATAVDMWTKDLPLYANRTWACPKCIFRTPCLAKDKDDLEGMEKIIKLQYTQRKLDDPLVPEEV